MNARFDLPIAYALDQDTRGRHHCGDPEARATEVGIDFRVAVGGSSMTACGRQT